MYIDAFSIDWFDLKFYAFPPISVIPRVLAKVKQDSAEGIIVVPFWPTQIWYPVMLKMLVSTPILLNSRKSLLVSPQTPNLVHPVWKKKKGTTPISKDLSGFVVKGTLIQFKQPLRWE